MRKNIGLLYRLVISAMVFFIISISSVLSQETKICTVETKEYSRSDAYMWGALYAASEGKVYIQV